MRLVVTRPQADGERTAAALRACSHEVLLAPLMRVEPVEIDLSGTWGAVIVTSANAPLAIQYAMEAVNHALDLTLSEGLYLEATLFGVCCATEDKTEGTKAFLEKRAAQFKGK